MFGIISWHCWRSKDELISNVFLWTPAHDQTKAEWPARTYIQQLCEDTGYSPEDLPEAMNDRNAWREGVRGISAGGTTWWWWYCFIELWVVYVKIWVISQRLETINGVKWVCIYTTLSPRSESNTVSIFKPSNASLKSEFSFWTGCFSKAKELSLLFYLPITAWGTDRFMPFSKAFAWSETQTPSFRIRTWISDSIFNDNDSYTKWTS